MPHGTGVKDPESVAEHSYKTAVIAYILFRLEDLHAGKVMLMTLLHDIPEARTDDAYRIVIRYEDWENIDKKTLADRSKRLPGEAAKPMAALFEEFEKEAYLGAKVVQDADLLEGIVQPLGYKKLGYSNM